MTASPLNPACGPPSGSAGAEPAPELTVSVVVDGAQAAAPASAVQPTHVVGALHAVDSAHVVEAVDAVEAVHLVKAVEVVSTMTGAPGAPGAPGVAPAVRRLWNVADLGLPAHLHQVTLVAVGILVARRRCNPEQALENLLDIAAQTDRSILEVAEQLIAHYNGQDRIDEIGPIEASDLTDAHLWSIT